MKKLTLMLVIALSLLISSCAVQPGRHSYYPYYDEDEGPIIFRHSPRFYGHSFHDRDHGRHHDRDYHHDNDHKYDHHHRDHD